MVGEPGKYKNIDVFLEIRLGENIFLFDGISAIPPLNGIVVGELAYLKK